MKLTYRTGTLQDLPQVKELAVKAWKNYQSSLTADNWLRLHTTLNDDGLFANLLNTASSFICIKGNTIIGMAFLVSKGNPTDIYDSTWSYIRFVSVDPEFGGQGIGKQLTAMCIETARQNGEETIALHTSEMMDKARHIYESAGFSVLREIEPRLGKRYWLYTLKLK